MKKHTNDFEHDAIPQLVLRLAIPTMLAQLVSVLYSIVDRMYIGIGVGDLALAGVGVCSPIVTLLSSFASLVGLGGSPIMAMRMGEGNQKEARRILNNAFLMLLGLSLVLTVLFWFSKAQLLMWFGASTSTFDYANTYVSIYTAGTVFALISAGMNSFLIAQGFSGLGMATVVLGAVLNIILDPVFIFLCHMGVAGAAIATVLSQLASCVFVLCSLFSKKMPVRLGIDGFQLRVVRKIVSFGFSPFLIIASDSILLIVLNTVLQRYGGPGEGDTLVTCATIVQSVSAPHHDAARRDHARQPAGRELQLRPWQCTAHEAGNPVYRAALRLLLYAYDGRDTYVLAALCVALYKGSRDPDALGAVYQALYRDDHPACRPVSARR